MLQAISPEAGSLALSTGDLCDYICTDRHSYKLAQQRQARKTGLVCIGKVLDFKLGKSTLSSLNFVLIDGFDAVSQANAIIVAANQLGCVRSI